MKRARLGPLWWVLVIGVTTGLTIVSFGALRVGGYVLAATLTFVGVVRLAVSDRAAEGASVRSRGMDFVIYIGFAIAVAVIFGTLRLSLPTS